MSRVGVVVVTHKALLALKRCLASLERGARAIPHRLQVIDSGSGGEVPAFLRSLSRRPGVTTRSFARNIGKAAALNVAAEADAGRSDWLIVLDDDAEVQPGWLGGLLAAARAHPRASIIGCRSFDHAGRIYSAEMIAWNRGAGFGEPDAGQRDYTRFCDAVTGVCLAIRRDAFLGLRFRKELNSRYEDADFCYAARQKGLRVLYHGAVGVRHEHLRRHSDPRGSGRRLMAAMWKHGAFPDSHPLDKAYFRAFAGAQSGDWQAVLAATRLLQHLDPVPAYAWGLAGLASWKLGRRAAALAAFRKALSLRHLPLALQARALASIAAIEAGRADNPTLCGNGGR